MSRRPDISRTDPRFRIVLCRLRGDPPAFMRRAWPLSPVRRCIWDTEVVEDAFKAVEGVELVRDDRIVHAKGITDVDHWKARMRIRARKIMRQRKAKLAIVGESTVPGELLHLWFVPCAGDGTLPRGRAGSYGLQHLTLQADFHNDLQEQIANTMADIIYRKTAVLTAVVNALAGDRPERLNLKL